MIRNVYYSRRRDAAGRSRWDLFLFGWENAHYAECTRFQPVDRLNNQNFYYSLGRSKLTYGKLRFEFFLCCQQSYRIFQLCRILVIFFLSCRSDKKRPYAILICKSPTLETSRTLSISRYFDEFTSWMLQMVATKITSHTEKYKWSMCEQRSRFNKNVWLINLLHSDIDMNEYYWALVNEIVFFKSINENTAEADTQLGSLGWHMSIWATNVNLTYKKWTDVRRRVFTNENR